MARACRIILITAVAALCGATARADDRCAPVATGIRGLAPPPAYLAAHPGVAQDTTEDDKRWGGATRVAYAFGAGEVVSFRATRFPAAGGGNDIYLAWTVYSNSTNGPPDGVWVGFSGATGNDAVHFTFKPATTPSAADDQDLTSSTIQWIAQGVHWAAGATPPKTTTAGAAPAWATANTRAWFGGAGALYQWGFKMKVNVPTDLAIGEPFKLWFQVERFNSVGVTAYEWPSGIAISAFNDLPDPTTWGSLHSEAAFACNTGVTIAETDIGVLSGTTIGTQIDINNPNTLIARIHNNGPDLAAHAVKARFRLANWGAQILDPTAPWDVIGEADNANQILNGQPGDITLTNYTPNRCDYIGTTGCPTPGTKSRDQCLYVQLLAGAAPGVSFDVDSVSYNMSLVGASTFKGTAQIGSGVKGGNQPPPGIDLHDYYLEIEQTNLPAVFTAPPPAIAIDGPNERISLSPARALAYLKGQGRQERSLGTITVNQLAAVTPTHRVNVYQDTGKKRQVEGRSYLVLKQLTSFGYFVEHTGALYGWKTGISGDHLTEIVPGKLYKLSPPTGIGTVTTTIQACETKADCEPPPCHGWRCWWWWILVLLLVLVILIVIIARRRP